VSESEAAARVEQLEKQLADLEARLPAHSVPPSMIAELDELEEALATAQHEWQEQQAREAGELPGDEGDHR
jgi:polyhydroxyalkanoate synthesis regulator phasin